MEKDLEQCLHLAPSLEEEEFARVEGLGIFIQVEIRKDSFSFEDLFYLRLLHDCGRPVLPIYGPADDIAKSRGYNYSDTLYDRNCMKVWHGEAGRPLELYIYRNRNNDDALQVLEGWFACYNDVLTARYAREYVQELLHERLRRVRVEK